MGEITYSDDIEIGEGSFGKVYLGWYKNNPTAIKYVFASNKEEKRLIEKEVKPALLTKEFPLSKLVKSNCPE